MSRIGKKLIIIPQTVTVTIDAGSIRIQGPKGTLTIPLHPHVHCAVNDGVLTVSVDEPEAIADRALWGTFGSIIRNAVRGVQEEYVKQLELVGIGFKAQVSGQTVTLSLGFSHPVTFTLPKEVQGSVEKNILTLRGVNKEIVGETAARIRSKKKPEPYQGKGIRYVGEVVRRKAGKAVKAAGASGGA